MEESSDPLVKAAVRPLSGDVELKFSARHLLESLKESRAEGTDEAIARWDAIDGNKRRRFWKRLFYFGVAAVSLLMLGHGFLDIIDYRAAVPGLDFRQLEPQELLDVSRYSTHEKLLLEIDDGITTESQRAKALWESDPQNAAYFSRYCGAYFSEAGKLPPDFQEQAKLIDPDNTYFPYWSATLAAKGIVNARSLSKAARAAGGAPEWDVKDEAKLDQALAILHECRDLPDYRDYAIQIIREIIPLLPQRTPSEYVRSVSFLSQTSELNYYSRDLAEAIAAKAWLLGERGDSEGLIALKKDADAYLRNFSRSEPGMPIQDIIVESRAKLVLKNLAAAATKLGLTDEAAESQARLDRLQKLKTDREAAGPFQIEGKDASLKLSVLSGERIFYLYRLALHPPTLTEAEVKPGRMIEHEFMAQLCTYGASGLLGLAAGAVALYRFRSPKVVRLLSARLEILLKPVDRLWLLAAGIAPFVYLLLVTRLADLGGSRWNILALKIELQYDGEILLPMAQFAGAVLMTLILTVLATRWRLAKRVPFFGFSKTRYWTGWCAILSAAVLVPLLGWSVIHRSDNGLLTCWVLAAIPINWLLAVFIRAMTQGMNPLLHLTTVSRVLVPTFSATMAALLLFTPWFKWCRQQWFEQDPINRLDANQPSLTKFEYQISIAARKELKEALGYSR